MYCASTMNRAVITNRCVVRELVFHTKLTKGTKTSKTAVQSAETDATTRSS